MYLTVMIRVYSNWGRGHVISGLRYVTGQNPGGPGPAWAGCNNVTRSVLGFGGGPEPRYVTGQSLGRDVRRAARTRPLRGQIGVQV